MDAVVQLVRVVRARDNALPAGNAPVGEEAEFRTGMLSFGVMTPEATERTALQEDCRADAWPIMEREALDIKNNVRQCHRLNDAPLVK
jgi:hypothetical protein